MSPYAAPFPHPSGALPPDLPAAGLPQHVAVVMDGNGRWANQRGLPRTEGHRAGEASLMEFVAGAVQLSIPCISVYAFSTENWRRSPSEIRFLMGYSRDVLRRRRDELNDWGVRIRWAGRRGRLWRSVVRELEDAQSLTRENTGTTLLMCVNYGGRAELVDAARVLAREAAEGRIDPDHISERSLARQLYAPEVPDVDLFLRTSGEQRTSNFMLWQSAYAEMAFLDKMWPEVDRLDLWDAVAAYAARDRRYGGAVDSPVARREPIR